MLVAFPLRLHPPCRRAVVPLTSLRRIWSKTSKRGCSASTTTPRRSFFLPLFLFSSIPYELSRFVWWMGLALSFLLLCPGTREKRYRYHVHIPDTCPSSRSICVFPSLVCIAGGRRAFLLDATRRDCPLRFFSVLLVVSRASTARSRRRRLMPNLIEAGRPSFQCIAQTQLLPCCYTNWNDMISRIWHSRNAAERKLRGTVTKFVSVPCDAIPRWILDPFCILRAYNEKKIHESLKRYYFHRKRDFRICLIYKNPIIFRTISYHLRDVNWNHWNHRSSHLVIAVISAHYCYFM